MNGWEAVGRWGIYRLRGSDAEGAALEHCGGEAGHDSMCLCTKISTNLIGSPSANQADAITINPGTKE